MSFSTYNPFELDALSDDNWGFRARAAAENRVYEPFGAPDEDEAAVEDVPEDESDWVPPCSEVKRIMDEALTVGQMSDALKAHKGAACLVCGTGNAMLVADRLRLGMADAVCCEGKAA